MSEERTPVSPEAEAPEYPARPEPCTISPEARAKATELGALMRSHIDELAAARESGRLEGDAAGYRRGLEEAIRILDALPRGLEPDWTGTTRDMSPKCLPARVRVPTVDEGVVAIRAKLEGK